MVSGSPASRKLAWLGIVASTLLASAGVAMDLFLGKAWIEAHPFIAGVPRALFPLTVIGTIGVWFLDELRQWTKSWPALRGLAARLNRETRRFLTLLGIELGLGERFAPLGGDNLRATVPFIVEFGSELGGAAMELNELHRVLAATESMPDPDHVRAIWTKATVSSDPPPTDVSARLTKVAEAMAATFDDIASHASTGTRETLELAASSLDETVADISETKDAVMAAFFREGEPDLDVVRRAALALGRLSTTLWRLVNCLARIADEAERGEPFREQA